MAITNNTSGLTSFNPVYNPLVYQFISTNVAEPGFRYVVDIYSAGTSTKIFEGRLAPQPSDNSGYIDVSKIISDYITHDVDVTGTTSIDCPSSYYNYDVKIGEEYQTEWDFDDTYFSTGGITLLTGTTTNAFVTGDQVVITQDTQLIPALEGLQTVYSAVSSTSIQINVQHISTSANTGTVAYADGRKTIFRDLLEYTAQTAYNAAFGSSEWIDYDSTDYLINATGVTYSLLTNHPQNYKVTEDQDLFVNAALNDNISFVKSMMFENDGGDMLFKTIPTSQIDYITQTAVGPNNLGTLTLYSGTTDLIKTDTEYYDFWIVNGTFQQVSDKYRVYIDRRCGIEDYQILFQDRKGSFNSFNFPLRADTKIRGNRETFNKQIGEVSNGKWTYNRTDAGEVNSNIDITKTITLRTNYVTSEMAVYFEELVFSPVTFVKIDGVYYSCVITDTNYNPKSLKDKKLNNLSVTIRLSNQDNINI